MFESDKKSSLERLKKSLYSRNTVEEDAPRHSIHGEQVVVPESWEASETPEPLEAPPELSQRRRLAYKILFISSMAFLIVALGVAAYTLLGGGNFISVDNVDITISGPALVAGGEPLPLDVGVVNKNQTEMRLVDLIAEYPQGTKDPSDPSKDLTRVRISLGNIASQSITQKTLSSIMFGQEGDVRDIKFTAEYRTPDSNAIFYKEKIYHVTISSSPLLVSVDALDKVLGGAPFDVTITVSSNTTDTIKNLLMSLDYPFGFSVISSDPPATYSDNIWQIGDIAPGGKRVIKLHASATGQDGENKTIHVNVGIESTTNERQIATNIITQDHDLTIEKPFIGLDLTFDGQSSDLSTALGHSVHADIIWTNNSSSQITNAVITAKLSGNVLDQNSITVDDGGFYNSQDNTITWQAGRSQGLDTIAPGADGRMSFTVSSLKSSPGQSVINPQIIVSVSAQGSRVDETGASQSVNTAVTRSIKLVSNLALSSRLLFSQGSIKNTGFMPPHVGKPTTYTVIWTVTNTSNNITGARVTAVLPQYVSWTGTIDPSDADISYDQKTGSVVWNVGEVPRNADIGTGAKQVAFQVSLTPSANQVGSIPDIMSQSSISGTDVFTGAIVQNSTGSLSTRISTDLLYKPGDEIIQQ